MRKILHLDLDAFFCAVEEQHNPDLIGKAFAVGGKPEHRGVVASCSYPARIFGIHSALPMSRAIRLCPQLIIVDNHRGEYLKMSRLVMAILHDTTPLVEQLSIDEAFMDVTGISPSAEGVARKLQARIREELDLPCSLGVATNKLVAKIANNIGKSSVKSDSPPNAIKVIYPGKEAAFLAPLPVRELWGVGPKTAERLAAMEIRTIGDLAAWPEADLHRRFGKLGRQIGIRAKGIDTRPVITEHETKSISTETTFIKDVRDPAKLRDVLRRQAEDVGRRLRKSGLRGRTVAIKLRYEDFTTFTRQKTLDQPTNQDKVITAAAHRLFEVNWERGREVRLVGVAMSSFDDRPYQLGLWDQPAEEETRLDKTLDDLRERFGDGAVKRASQLRREDDEA